jgi:hypothetical protein
VVAAVVLLCHPSAADDRKGVDTGLVEGVTWCQVLVAAGAAEVDRGHHTTSLRHQENRNAPGPEPDCANGDRPHGLERKPELGKRRA